MIWNKEIRKIERGKYILLFKGERIIKILKSDYDILNRLMEGQVPYSDIARNFVRKEDGEYISHIAECLIEEQYLENEAAQPKKTKISLNLLLTNQCNLSCRHCCQDAECIGKDEKEFSTGEWKGVIERLRQLPIENVMISGGEALLREDFQEIIQYLHKRLKCPKILMTNGLLINENNVEFLKNHFDEISISLDGSDAELTEIVRGRDVHFTVLKKIELLKNYGVENISLSAILPNSDKVEEDFLKLCERYQVNPELRSYSYTGRGEVNSDCLYQEFESYLERKHYSSYNTFERETFQWLGNCQAGKTNLTIDAKGNVFPCNLLQDSDMRIANVWDVDFEDKWSSYKKCDEEEVFKNTPCEICEYRFLCWHCISEFRTYVGTDIFDERCRIKKRCLQNEIQEVIESKGDRCVHLVDR